MGCSMLASCCFQWFHQFHQLHIRWAHSHRHCIIGTCALMGNCGLKSKASYNATDSGPSAVESGHNEVAAIHMGSILGLAWWAKGRLSTHNFSVHCCLFALWLCFCDRKFLCMSWLVVFRFYELMIFCCILFKKYFQFDKWKYMHLQWRQGTWIEDWCIVCGVWLTYWLS